LIADDPDAPVGTWTHWLIWNFPAQSTGLPKGVPKVETLDDGTRQGRIDFRRIGYGGPCPPPERPHRYSFKVCAIDAGLDLRVGANRDELGRAMKGQVLAQGELMSKYGRYPCQGDQSWCLESLLNPTLTLEERGIVDAEGWLLGV
jgi:hypothetical protein